MFDRIIAWIRVLCGDPQPAAPSVAITFVEDDSGFFPRSVYPEFYKGKPMSLTATLTLSAPDPKVPVTQRTVVYAVTPSGGTAGAPVSVSLDAAPYSTTFSVNDGDTVAGTATDTSAGGVSSTPTSFSAVAHDTVTVPASPTVTLTFAPSA